MTRGMDTNRGVARLSSLLTGLIVIFAVAMILFGPSGLNRITQAPMAGPAAVGNQG